MDREIAAALLGPVILAALGVATVLVRHAVRRRADLAQRAEMLGQAAEEVDRIEEWLTAYAEVDSAVQRQERAAQALAHLRRSYAAHQAALAPPPPARTAADLASSLLLLGLRDRAARGLRGLYYVLVLGALFLTGLGMTLIAGSSDASLLSLVLVAMLVPWLAFFPARLMHGLARLADRPGQFPRPLDGPADSRSGRRSDYPQYPHRRPGVPWQPDTDLPPTR